ncbi:MAG: hypothetical protein H6721_26915 [Sandaracinus sp.]|nr:hypothetical protein [Sandaracinus sp.]
MSTPSLLFDSVGLALGFVAPHGVAAAELESPRSLAPTRSLHLGTAPADVSPQLVRRSGRLFAAYVDLDGAHVAAAGEAPRRLADEAHAVDLAFVGSELWVVVAGEELVLHVLDTSLTSKRLPQVLAPRRDVRDPRLCVMGGDVLLLYTLADPALVVHPLGDARAPVRHPLATRPESLVVEAVPGTVAFALQEEGGRVSVGTLDRSGRAKERLHRLPREGFGSVSMLWARDEFWVGMHDLASERYELLRLDGRVAQTRDHVEAGAWAARRLGRQLVLATTSRHEARSVAVLHTMDDDGTVQRHELDVSPSDAEDRARFAAARGMLRHVGVLAPTLGYRGGVRARQDDDGRLELGLEGAMARLWVEPAQDAFELLVAVGTEATPEIPAAKSGWRTLFSRVAPWAREMLGEGAVDAGEGDAGVWVRARLEEVPEAAKVLEWVRALVERVRS